MKRRQLFKRSVNAFVVRKVERTDCLTESRFQILNLPWRRVSKRTRITRVRAPARVKYTGFEVLLLRLAFLVPRNRIITYTGNDNLKERKEEREKGRRKEKRKGGREDVFTSTPRANDYVLGGNYRCNGNWNNHARSNELKLANEISPMLEPRADLASIASPG